MFEKVPQPYSPAGKVPTMRKMKYLMRGPEQIHNTLLYGDFGIQVSKQIHNTLLYGDFGIQVSKQVHNTLVYGDFGSQVSKQIHNTMLYGDLDIQVSKQTHKTFFLGLGYVFIWVIMVTMLGKICQISVLRECR